MNYLLFNPLANNNTGEKKKDEVLVELAPKFGEFEATSVIGLNTDEFLAKLTKDDVVVLVGGDGTINRCANEIYGKDIPCKFYVYKAGTGNDFLKDVEDKMEGNLLELNPYVQKLPKVYVNGEDKGYYVNGIGYGIDGQCCVVAEKLKKEGKEKISYAGISIKLCLHGYKCPDAEVIVDGKSYQFKKVWLASGMHGRYYGGGMNIAPNQNRLGDKLSVSLLHGSSKLKTLIIFPQIFKGTHVKYTKNVTILEGNEITVKFSIPTALQIDGEVVENVTEYRVVK